MTRLDATSAQRLQNVRSGRMEIWLVASADGQWEYERTDDSGTTWTVTHVPTKAISIGWPSLAAARRYTAEETTGPGGTASAPRGEATAPRGTDTEPPAGVST